MRASKSVVNTLKYLSGIAAYTFMIGSMACQMYDILKKIAEMKEQWNDK